jgi:predicted transcriptional regulator
LEFALLSALWERDGEEVSARELYDHVGKARGVVYTTVAKVLDRLVSKRLIRRRRIGRSYTYSPVAERAETHRAMARSLLEQIVTEDPEPAIAALVGAMEDISPDLLTQLRAELAARKGTK